MEVITKSGFVLSAQAAVEVDRKVAAVLRILDEPTPATKLKPPREIDTPTLDATEAAKYCGMAVQTFYNHCSCYGWPTRTRNRRYTREALDIWLRTRTTARRKPRR